MKSSAPHLHLTVAFAISLAACGGTEPPPVPPAPAPPPESAVASPPAAPSPVTTGQAPSAEAPRPPVEIEPMAPPAAPNPMPTVKITAPKADQVIPVDKAPGFEVTLDVKDWDVKEGGPHIHVILDNQPYYASFDPKKPVTLREVAPDANLAEGQHVLVAFPSRDNHIAVKPDGGKKPYAVVPFWVGKKGTATWKPTDPTLVYSRPKGEYAGPTADEVFLDFYLLNAELGEGKFMVHPTVTPPKGEARSITVKTWQPFRLKNLSDGETKVKLELRDAKGVVVPGPWNTVERSITVSRGSAPK